MPTLILLILALICFGLAAFSVAVGRVNLIGLGLALVTLTWVLDKLPEV